jgi:hypothetical protein
MCVIYADELIIIVTADRDNAVTRDEAGSPGVKLVTMLERATTGIANCAGL